MADKLPRPPLPACPDCGRRGHGRCTDAVLCDDHRMSRSNDD